MTNAITNKLTAIQDEFGAIAESLLPDVKRYLTEIEEVNCSDVTASNIILENNDWCGRSLTVRYETPWHETEKVNIGFEYFDNPDAFIAEQNRIKEAARKAKEDASLEELIRERTSLDARINAFDTRIKEARK